MRTVAVVAMSRVILLAIVATISIGLFLRLVLAGTIQIEFNFAFFRHAHSHLGYYGVLLPLAWMAWHVDGVPLPRPALAFAYAAAVIAATIGFFRSGYSGVSIAGSTVVAFAWILHSWRLRRALESLGARSRDPQHLLRAVPFGVVLSLACIPPIAIFLRRDAALSQGWVSTFLAALLFVVVVPTCLHCEGARGRWVVLLLTGCAGALALGAWAVPMTRAALILYGAFVLRMSFDVSTRSHRWLWITVAIGLIAAGSGLVAVSRPIAIAGTHFIVLGPALGTLTPLIGVPAGRAWQFHVGWAAIMAAGIATDWPISRCVAAVGGGGIVVWWIAALPTAWRRAGTVDFDRNQEG